MSKSGLMKDYQLHIYLTYSGNCNSLSLQVKIRMFWGKPLSFGYWLCSPTVLHQQQDIMLFPVA